MVHVQKRRRQAALACAAVVALVAATVPSVGQAATGTSSDAGKAAGSYTAATTAPAAAARTTTTADGSAKQHTGIVPGEVIVSLTAGTSVTGGPVAGTRDAARQALTSNAQLNTALRAQHVVSLHPLLPELSSATTGALSHAAVAQLGAGSVGLGTTYVLQTGDQDSNAVAKALQSTPGVAFAEPDRYVNTMDTGAQAVPSAVLKAAPATSSSASAAASRAQSPQQGAAAAAGGSYASHVPTNYALADSAQPLLNSGGVDASGAYALLGKDFGQLPGAGETVTDVTLADLTDSSMSDAGDAYVQRYGPTTVVQNGQRYLDLPSMPLIPSYVADPDGTLSGSESVEGQDPVDSEAMLDFSVMSPLPDGDQRAGMTGSGYSDLLGIAPGADYRLVVPQQPTTDQIAQALISAATQSPRPNVITCTMGFGTDAQGIPSRYLEDDPLMLSVVTSIVHQYGIVVAISANDGTRLFTPTGVGPDGGSTATDLARNAASATNINDDQESTAPSEVPDSGAIDVGGSTLDDTLSNGSTGPATTAETRISGAGNFSSGFGSRVNVSAPSDNVVSFSHTDGGTAQDVTVSLDGGTSASAPQVAAAAAIVLQASRLGGRRLDPLQVRSLLESTGRAVPTPSQIDQPLNVGPQIDVTAATVAALGPRAAAATGGSAAAAPSIVRLSVGHHVDTGALGGAFVETTDPSTLDLSGLSFGFDGAGLVGPVTFGGDVVGAPAGPGTSYALSVGKTTWRSNQPSIRVTPTQLLDAAGLPVIATADRTVNLTYSVLVNGRVRASVQRTITVGPSDGTYEVSQAPTAPASVQAGKSVTVHYDLTGVTQYTPELVVSTIGHWNPALAPNYVTAWSHPLTATSGTVTVPASAFDDGGGIYGIGIVETTEPGGLTNKYAQDGEFTSILVQGGSFASRPAAPTLAAGSSTAGHYLGITRETPGFTLKYNVRGIPGAVSAMAEFSAPTPTNYNSFSTFSNSNGNQLDKDGLDSPSVAHRAISGTAGSVKLNALQLGLSTSLSYNVRVFALDRNGKIVGQASPFSTLEFDDGLIPSNDLLMTFAAAGSDSLAAIETYPNNGSEVVHYDTATGQFGAVMAADPNTFAEYEVLGVDPAGQRALLAYQSGPDATTAEVESWNTTTNKMVGSWSFSNADWAFIGGQVDRTRDRAAVLLQSKQTPDDSEVISLDLATGVAGTPIAVTSGYPFGLLTIDESTGDVYLAAQSSILICIGASVVDQVNLDTGAVTTVGDVNKCGHAVAANDGTFYDMVAMSASTKLPSNTLIDPLDVATGVVADPVQVLDEAPVAMAVDPVHDLAVVSYVWPQGVPEASGDEVIKPYDNNATGVMAVVNLKTGALVKTLPGFQVVNDHGNSLANLGTAHSIQLDPSTETGYTYAPYSNEIQQFSY